MLNNKGFTLLESVIAIFIVTMGVGGVFTLVSQTISGTSILSSKLTAIYLAQEGVEVVRHIRDNNFLEIHQGVEGATWDNNLEREGLYYIDYRAEEKNISNLVLWQENEYRHYSQSQCAIPDPCQDTSFNRSIEITYPQNYIMNVKSVVTWQERGITHQASVQENLYKWLQQ